MRSIKQHLEKTFIHQWKKKAELGVVLNHVILDQDLPIKIHGLEKYSQDRMHQSEQDQIVFDDRQVKRVKH